MGEVQITNTEQIDKASYLTFEKVKFKIALTIRLFTVELIWNLRMGENSMR